MLAPVKWGGGAGLCSCLLSHGSMSCLPCSGAAMVGARETEAGAQRCASPHSPCTHMGMSPREVQKHRSITPAAPSSHPHPPFHPRFSCRGAPPPPLLQPLSHPGLPGTSQLKISQAGAGRLGAKFPAWLRSLPPHGCWGSRTTAGVMLTHAVPQFPHPEATTSLAGQEAVGN